MSVTPSDGGPASGGGNAGNGPSSSKRALVLSILIMTVGVGWLLTALGFGPGIDWVWTLGLGVGGLLAFVFSGGIDKVSLVVGPFLIASSLLAILRQTGRLTVDIEVPILVILAGGLLAIAQMKVVRMPNWLE